MTGDAPICTTLLSLQADPDQQVVAANGNVMKVSVAAQVGLSEMFGGPPSVDLSKWLILFEQHEPGRVRWLVELLDRGAALSHPYHFRTALFVPQFGARLEDLCSSAAWKWMLGIELVGVKPLHLALLFRAPDVFAALQAADSTVPPPVQVGPATEIDLAMLVVIWGQVGMLPIALP